MKKTAGTAKKVPDTAAKDTKLLRSPDNGYCVIEKDGRKFVHYIGKGLPLPSDYIFFGSQEEACSIAGVEFHPFAPCSFSDATKEEFDKRHDRIGESVLNIDNSALRIAFDLHWVNAKKAYAIKCFHTIVDYAKFYFGYEKTSCYSLIGIVDRFARRDKDGNILEEIDPAFSAYSSSKLSLMVNLTDDQIGRLLKPAMSFREIKKIVKSLDDSKNFVEKKEDAGEENIPPDHPGTNTGEDIKVDSIAKEIVRNTLLSYKGAKDYGKKFNADKINDHVLGILKDHPDAVIEISYILPQK